MNKICVTGASGFVGAALCRELHERGFFVRGIVRSLLAAAPISDIEYIAVGNLSAVTDWSSALVGSDCVIHCAARAHVMRESEVDALAAYRSVNVDGSRHLAEQAAAAGVRRLVYLSSIGVNGIHTNSREPFVVSDAPKPAEDYAISKWEAEQALWAVAANTSLELVVVRPPLVYGPGVKGNLARLMRLVCSGVPLPLGAVQNQRSLIGLHNLVDLLICCVDHPAAASRTFLASDGQDFSTSQFIRLMAEGMNRRPRLLPMPVALLQMVGSLIGKRGEIDRLIGSLQVDSRDTQMQLEWSPAVSAEDGVWEMARWYAGSQAN